MTSYTKKLYNRDPAAALAFYHQDRFEQARALADAERNGREVVFQPWTDQPRSVTFGKRQSPPTARHACPTRCSSPACRQGCVLFVDQSGGSR